MTSLLFGIMALSFADSLAASGSASPDMAPPLVAGAVPEVLMLTGKRFPLDFAGCCRHAGSHALVVTRRCVYVCVCVCVCMCVYLCVTLCVRACVILCVTLFVPVPGLGVGCIF
jgi:hypothetical protein